MYKVGDIVIYKSEGVCRVSDIEVKTFRDKEIEYYVLKPVYKENSEIFVPKNNIELVSKMRQVLTREEIINLIKSMPDEDDIWIENENQRKEEYKQLIASGDRTKLIRLIKTLFNHKQKQKEAGKKLHITDDRLLKDAEKVLYDEFAYVLNISQNQVVPFIVGELDK